MSQTVVSPLPDQDPVAGPGSGPVSGPAPSSTTARDAGAGRRQVVIGLLVLVLLAAAATATIDTWTRLEATRLATVAGTPWLSLGLLVVTAGVVAWAVCQIARAAGEAERARIEAIGLASMRADFVAIVSHEIRTPVVVIRGMLDTALDDAVEVDAGTRRDLLQRAQEAAARLDRLTSDVLTSTLVEQRRIEPVHRDVLLADLLRASVRGSRLVDDHGLVVETSDELRLTTDPVLAGHVIANLLDNAATHGEPPVVVRAGPRAGHVEIEVVDHGAGLVNEATAFAAYGQGAAVLTRRHGGVGLGLHLARTIAGSLGGRLTYAREGGTTVFRLTLPHPVPPPPEDHGG